MAQLSRITDARPSTIDYRGDLTPPIVSYAAAVQNNNLLSQNRVPPSTNRSGSSVVSRRPRRDGLRYYYSHGGTVMPAPNVPTPGNGGVANSRYQTILVQLQDWSTNLAWFAAGYPRNLGYSWRQPQPTVQASGGATSATMDARPIFPRVQRVPRASVSIPTYNTRSTNG